MTATLPAVADTAAGPVADSVVADPSMPRGGATPPRRGRRGVRPRPPARPRPPTPDGAATGVAAFLILAACCAWLLLQLFPLGALEQSRAQRMLYAELREQLAAQTAPTGGAIAPGEPVALLTIPTLGLQQVVVEGTSSGDLLAGPGHRRDTVLPGQAGTSIVYGRAATYGAPFRQVGSLQEGDGIQVTTGQGEFVYRVDRVRRTGDPTPPALAAGEARLTLVSAEGSGLLAALTPDTTVYVDATLQADAVGGTGRPSSIPDSERAMAVDTTVLPALALALQGVLAAATATTLLRRRMPVAVLWMIIAPVLLALAWVAGDLAALLLPNLL